MGNITKAIEDIGKAEANLDKDAAKEKLSAADITNDQLESHKEEVEVPDSKIRQKIAVAKNLISQLKGDSTETEAQILEALNKAVGSDPKKSEWLATELGIDAQELIEDGSMFGLDDLAKVVEAGKNGNEESEENKPVFERVANILDKSNLAQFYSQDIQNFTTQLRSPAITGPGKLVIMSKALSIFKGYREFIRTLPEGHRDLAKPKITALDDAIKKIEGIGSTAKEKTEGTDKSPESKEVKDKKETIYSILGKVIKSPSSKPSDIKKTLVEKLLKADNVGKVLDDISSGLDSPDLAKSLKKDLGPLKKLILDTGIKTVIANLKTKHGSEKATKEQAEKIADGILGIVDTLDKANKPAAAFELTPIGDGEISKRASNLVSIYKEKFKNGSDKLVAGDVKKFLGEQLTKALSSKDIGALKTLGQVLGFAVNGENTEEIIKKVTENKDKIIKRIEALSKEVNGKTKQEIQGAAVEQNKKNANDLIDSAADAYPEYVGTERWNNWVDKLAKGETQKSFKDYLAEDAKPLEGFESVIMMLKKLFIQLGGMFDKIFGNKDKKDPIKKAKDAAKQKISDAYLLKLGKKYGITVKELKEDEDGELRDSINFYSQNKEIFGKLPNLNIAGMEPGKRGVILLLKEKTSEERKSLVDMIRSSDSDSKPYMKGALSSGLEGNTVSAIYNFETKMKEQKKEAKLSFDENTKKLKINNKEVDLKSGGDSEIMSALDYYLGLKDLEEDTPEKRKTHDVKFKALDEFSATGKVDLKKVPDILLKKENREILKKFLGSFTGKLSKSWGDYKMSEKDVTNFITKRGSAFDAADDAFHINKEDNWEVLGELVDDTGEARSFKDEEDGKEFLEVDGTGYITDYKFVNIKAFFKWLDQQ